MCVGCEGLEGSFAIRAAFAVVRGRRNQIAPEDELNPYKPIGGSDRSSSSSSSSNSSIRRSFTDGHGADLGFFGEVLGLCPEAIAALKPRRAPSLSEQLPITAPSNLWFQPPRPRRCFLCCSSISIKPISSSEDPRYVKDEQRGIFFFLGFTLYVTFKHWRSLGPVRRLLLQQSPRRSGLK